MKILKFEVTSRKHDLQSFLRTVWNSSFGFTNSSAKTSSTTSGFKFSAGNSSCLKQQIFHLCNNPITEKTKPITKNSKTSYNKSITTFQHKSNTFVQEEIEKTSVLKLLTDFEELKLESATPKLRFSNDKLAGRFGTLILDKEGTAKGRWEIQ